jgi:hypothetical protein
MRATTAITVLCLTALSVAGVLRLFSQELEIDSTSLVGRVGLTLMAAAIVSGGVSSARWWAEMEGGEDPLAFMIGTTMGGVVLAILTWTLPG